MSDDIDSLVKSKFKMVERAFEIAKKAHRNQFRFSKNNKNEKIPYIIHPIQVMVIADKIAKKFKEIRELEYKEDDMFLQLVSVVALLHDTVEDSEDNFKQGYIPEKDIVTLKMIEEEFGETVATSVDNLTKRNEEYDVTILRAKQNSLSAIVKAADNIHNASTLDVSNPSQKQKRRTYLVSRRYLLEYLNLTPEMIQL